MKKIIIFNSNSNLFNGSVSNPIRIGASKFNNLSASEQKAELAYLEPIVFPHLSEIGKREYASFSRTAKYGRLVNRVHTLRNLSNRNLGSSYVGKVLSAPKFKDGLIRIGATDFSKLPQDEQQAELERLKSLIFKELSSKTKKEFSSYTLQEQYETLLNKVHTNTHKSNVASSTKKEVAPVPQRRLKSLSDCINDRKVIFKEYPAIYDSACAIIDKLAEPLSSNLSSTEKSAILKKIDDFRDSIINGLCA